METATAIPTANTHSPNKSQTKVSVTNCLGVAINVMNIIQTIPNASYFEKFQHLLNIRQQRFDEVRADALIKAAEILRS